MLADSKKFICKEEMPLSCGFRRQWLHERRFQLYLRQRFHWRCRDDITRIRRAISALRLTRLRGFRGRFSLSAG